ncbi:MAG: hypothetical protein U5N85_02610 [Arcicella sp.]|nr:hypothetical protein [Arcicella sp.]
MKKVSLIIAGFALIFSACDTAKEAKQDALTNMMEKAIESKTGTQIDLPDAADMAENGGSISYKSTDKVYLKGDEKMQATLTFNKDKNQEKMMIALQMVGENGKSFMVTFNQVPENFSLPLKGKFAVSNAYDGVNPTASVMFLNISKNGMEASVIPYEGELILTKLSKDKVEFEINGKGGDVTDVESPSNWKSISGGGKATNPIIMSYGIDKNKVLK